jgi:hypothetical protein
VKTKTSKEPPDTRQSPAAFDFLSPRMLPRPIASAPPELTALNLRRDQAFNAMAVVRA